MRSLVRSGAGGAGAAVAAPARRLRRAAFAFVVLVGFGVLGLGVLASSQASGWLVASPGNTWVVSSLCRVAGPLAFTLPGGGRCVALGAGGGRLAVTAGQVRVVNVSQHPASSWEWLEGQVGLLGGGARLISAQTGWSGVTPVQWAVENALAERLGAATAVCVAERQVGLRAACSDDGAVILAVVAGSPAASTLRVGDVVTGFDGVPVRSESELQDDLRHTRPGERIVMRVARAASGAPALVSARLAAPVPGNGTAGTGFLGVIAVTFPSLRVPVPVTVLTRPGLTGPSGGLSETLATIDALTDGALTRDLRIAATGTIAPDGSVGEISDADLKAIAVSRSGARLFLVPPANLNAARATARPGLRVIPVATLAQALHAIAAARD